MKFNSIVFGLLTIILLSGCADQKADLEKAKFLLGKGDRASAIEAYNIVNPLLTSTSGSEKVEAYRLYAGAQMQKAGIDPINIISVLIYKTSDNTLALTEQALSGLTDDADDLFSDVNTKMGVITADAAYTNASTREKNGIQFQWGIEKLLNALRISLQTSGVTAGTFDVDDCKNISSSPILAHYNTVTTDLNSADDRFADSGLNANNPLRTITNAMIDQVEATGDPTADLQRLCDYIEAQRNL